MSDTQRTAQELFDHVVKSLIAQGAPSISNSSCRYRGPNGRKCAAGHCIPTGLRAQEGASWKSQSGALRDAVGHTQLVSYMQVAHDRDSICLSAWRGSFAQRLRAVATLYNLDAAVLDGIPESWKEADDEQ